MQNYLKFTKNRQKNWINLNINEPLKFLLLLLFSFLFSSFWTSKIFILDNWIALFWNSIVYDCHYAANQKVDSKTANFRNILIILPWEMQKSISKPNERFRSKKWISVKSIFSFFHTIYELLQYFWFCYFC